MKLSRRRLLLSPAVIRERGNLLRGFYAPQREHPPKVQHPKPGASR